LLHIIFVEPWLYFFGNIQLFLNYLDLKVVRNFSFCASLLVKWYPAV